MLPFVINRLRNHRQDIEKRGHEIKFAVSRGPFNIATFLMGTTEFLMATQLNPDRTQDFLKIITSFVVDWIAYQIEMFPTIDGILILDDIIGFVGENDFKEFMLPYLKDIFNSFDVKIKFLHNDAEGLVSAPYLPEIGINLFNYSFKHSFSEMKSLTKNKIVLLGNIPPRDTLAQGSVGEIEKW